MSKIVKEIQEKNPGIKEWGAVGFCWGGKIVNLTCVEGGVFKAAAIAHPAMIGKEDGERVGVPILCLPSGDESKEDVEAYEKALKVEHEVEWYPEQLHGWMAAR